MGFRVCSVSAFSRTYFAFFSPELSPSPSSFSSSAGTAVGGGLKLELRALCTKLAE